MSWRHLEAFGGRLDGLGGDLVRLGGMWKSLGWLWKRLGGDLGRLGGVFEVMMTQDSIKIAKISNKVPKTLKNQ